MSHRSLATILTVVTLVALVALAADGASPAQSASFIVNATHDAVDATPGDGSCADAGGACTLRAAIMEANALVGQDEITLPEGTYVLSIGGAGEDAAGTGDLDITDDLTINGGGTDSTAIDGAGSDRVIHIIIGTVRITDLTIRNGLAGTSLQISPCHPFPDQENGGGVCNEAGAGVLARVDVVSNSVDFRHGNGVYNAGHLVIEDGTVRDNTGPGSAIVNDGVMTVRRVIIRNNESFGFWNRAGSAVMRDIESTGNFRGIENWSSQLLDINGARIVANTDSGIRHIGDTLTLTNVSVAENLGRGITNGEGGPSKLLALASTISGNASSGIVNGGPIVTLRRALSGVVAPVPGEVTLTNVTVSGNGATDGHGIESAGHISLTNVTIAENSGGGVFSPPGSAEANSSLVNTILAFNRGGDCAGELHVSSLGHNANVDGNCALNGPGDFPHAVINLAALADNGGPTQTHALPRLDQRSDVLAQNDAIDGGDPTSCPATDQRGEPRPFDGDGNGTAVCDIGAFELREAPLRCEPGPCGVAFATPSPTPTLPITLPPSGGPSSSSAVPLLAAIALPALAMTGVIGGRLARRVITHR